MRRDLHNVRVNAGHLRSLGLSVPIKDGAASAAAIGSGAT
jgi:hypothetical protein